MVLDLKTFRENHNYMTQEELAQAIDVNVEVISKIEDNSEMINTAILIKIADITGMTLDQLVNYKVSDSSEMNRKDEWSSVIAHGNNIHIEMVKEISQHVQDTIKKPKVAFVGLSDTGKSSLINSLVGEDKMPASWTPTTSISVHVKHIEDKPSFINGDTWIIKAQVEDKMNWNPNRYNDSNYMKDWLYKDGSSELLFDYGVRKSDKISDQIGSAVIFLDSDILRVCDIIDLPGFGTGDRMQDDEITSSAIKNIDIVLYLSLVNGFMRGNDIECLMNSINQFPILESESNGIMPLSNLFIIASQADIIKGVELKKILDEGSKRLYSKIDDRIWTKRKETTQVEYTESHLRDRFFAYSKDIHSHGERLVSELKNTVEHYQMHLKDKVVEATQFICEEKPRLLTNGITMYEDLYLNFADKAVERFFIDLLQIKDGGVRLEDIEDIESIEFEGTSDKRIVSLVDFKLLRHLKVLKLPENNIMDLSPLSCLERLEILDLSGNERINDISCLSNLSNLKELNLSTNNITDITPLNVMSKLEMLDVCHNHLIDITFADEIMGLKHLDLCDNKIECIEHFESLSGLEYLDLTENILDSISVEHCENIKELYVDEDTEVLIDSEIYFDLDHKNFDLDCVLFEDSVLEGQISFALYGVTGRKVLVQDAPKFKGMKLNWDSTSYKLLYKFDDADQYYVRGSGVTGAYKITSLQGLQHFKNLVHFEMRAHLITDISPLSDLLNLKYVDLFSNFITNIEPLGALEKLEDLNLVGSGLSNIEPLGNLKTLRRLILNGNRIVDVEPISRMNSMEILALINNQITNVKPLAELESLKELYVSKNSIKNVNVLGRLENLKALNIDRNNWKDTSGLADIYDQLTDSDFRIVYYDNMIQEMRNKHGAISNSYSEVLENYLIEYYETDRSLVSLMITLYRGGFGDRLLTGSQFFMKFSARSCIFNNISYDKFVHHYDNTWYTRDGNLGFAISSDTLYYTGLYSTTVYEIELSSIHIITVDSSFKTITINKTKNVHIERMDEIHRIRFYAYLVELVNYLKLNQANI